MNWEINEVQVINRTHEFLCGALGRSEAYAAELLEKTDDREGYDQLMAHYATLRVELNQLVDEWLTDEEEEE